MLFHLSIDADDPRHVAEVFAEIWNGKYRKRGGQFGVIEMWIEGWRMVEVLTPDMQAEYLAMLRGRSQ